MNKKIAFLLASFMLGSFIIGGIISFSERSSAGQDVCLTPRELDERYLLRDLSNSDSAIWQGDLGVTGDMASQGLVSSYQGVETHELLRYNGKFVCLGNNGNVYWQDTNCPK